MVEDVLTTGGSVELVSKSILAARATVRSYVGVLVNRSGLKDVDGKKIIALITKEMPMWDLADCPLCKQGSEAIRPRQPAENWARLNAPY
ncbi:hypothetical protein KW783_02420 [Candidatus Parcubacteria bacterium]|nr:hypothetical protein [Candidatus Parcubacteria bacterium]